MRPISGKPTVLPLQSKEQRQLSLIDTLEPPYRGLRRKCLEGKGLMRLSGRFFGGAALLLVLAGTTGCTKLKARDQLVKGVNAFKAGKYEEAVNHFQTSVDLDPSYATARLDLAAAYSYEVVPNLDTPDNLKI